MKPYGREKKIKGGRSNVGYCGNWKRDVHPWKGYVNWWEDMCTILTRSAMKSITKKTIEQELEE